MAKAGAVEISKDATIVVVNIENFISSSPKFGKGIPLPNVELV